MASEDIKKELNDAKEQLRKAEAAVTAFEGDENRGKLLGELRGSSGRGGVLTARQLQTLDELAAEKTRLEGAKNEWEKQVRLLQDRLTAPQTGNDFVTRRWGHRVVCT